MNCDTKIQSAEEFDALVETEKFLEKTVAVILTIPTIVALALFAVFQIVTFGKFINDGSRPT